MSISIENFVKEVYQINHDLHLKATTSRIAERLNVSNAAITDMAKKLSKQDLVSYQKYKEIGLTLKGEKMALSIIRKHRLWEAFLQKVLKLNDDEIHNEAELLEHQTSDFLLSKIDQYLNSPKFDPHGDPIPDKDGTMPIDHSFQLCDAIVGETYVVKRIINREEDISKKLDHINISRGVLITIKQAYNNGSLLIELDNNQVNLDNQLVELIYVIKK